MNDIHYVKKDSYRYPYAVCGHSPVFMNKTEDVEEVTCGSCKISLRKEGLIK